MGVLLSLIPHSALCLTESFVYSGMRVGDNEPQRVNAEGVDSSAVAVAEPVLPVEVGEGAAPNQVSSRQDGSGVHTSVIEGDPDNEEEGKQEEDDPQDVLFNVAEDQRQDEVETPAQDNARSEFEREAELAQQRVSRANRRATRSDAERDAGRERNAAVRAARRAERTEEEQDQDNMQQRAQRRTRRWKEALANHEDFDIEKVTGENVFNGRHKLPDPTIICEHCRAWR
ncbi:hypothetical protein BBJ28_00020352 [Nothophytophthora sp. Chile5]|nr:hypothetical protein BBJ28_00020352 [Nothophytophthora sp. Chile5]